MKKAEIKTFLDEKAEQYENPFFLEEDPIQLPHRFSAKEDIEIAGFLVALIAWGNRKSILKSGNRLLEMLDHSPASFVKEHQPSDRQFLESFVHRTFQNQDFPFMVAALQRLYKEEGGLEGFFSKPFTISKYPDHLSPLQVKIGAFKDYLFQLPHQERSRKHIADPLSGSAAKRINMYLRWMVRPAQKGVDFGIWKGLSPSELSCPLDVHTAKVARKLKILKRKQNDSKTVAELDKALRQLDSNDPVKYDFALFGLGAYEGF